MRPLPQGFTGKERQGIELRGCELMFNDIAQADRLQRTVEEATGAPCPCTTGRRCPLVPAQVALVPTPSPRRGIPLPPLWTSLGAACWAASHLGLLAMLLGDSLPLPLPA